MDDFAARNGFDPLIPENWREFTAAQLRKYNVCIEKRREGRAVVRREGGAILKRQGEIRE